MRLADGVTGCGAYQLSPFFLWSREVGVLSAGERRKTEKPGRAPGAMGAHGWFWGVQFEVFTELLVFPLVFKIGLALPPFPLTWVSES